MSAESIARALGGQKAGATWMARCPAHDDRNPSLALRDADDGHVLLKCHAGCSQLAVLEVLRRLGLWEARAGRHRGAVPPAPAHARADVGGRTLAALTIWSASRSPRGTPVEIYLQARGLELPPTVATIRFHAALRHPNGGLWPAMVALITDIHDRPIGIHRTFLARGGVAKADVVPQKMMLGSARGGAVRLAAPSSTLLVSEGVENGLAVMLATGLPVWAALSTSGLRSLELPVDVEEVVILADADPPGEAAAGAAAGRWLREGRRVRIARPTGGSKDFNDLLCGAPSTRPSP